jgi:long-chain fatty acid transport protein
MKKGFFCLSACFLVMILASSAFAGGVVNKTNWSAEYIRTMNRNAATDYADIVFYNPAGTVFMDTGAYVNISAHYFPKLYQDYIKTGPFEGRYKSDEPSVVPGIFTTYNEDKWSMFFGVSNVVGGGAVEFDDGSLTTVAIGAQYMAGVNAALAGAGVPEAARYHTIKSQKMEGEQMGPGYMIGGAYKISDQVSLSLGVRYIDAQKEANGTATIATLGPAIPGVNDDRMALVDYEWDAQGFGGIFGINYAPSKNTTFAARYETRTKLNYEYTVKKDELQGSPLGVLASRGITDGMKKREDHPATLGLGASHRFCENIRMETNLTWYFNKGADWAGAERNFRDGYDLGLALEYNFTEELLGSVGYLYTFNGIKSRYANDITVNLPENPNLDSHSVVLGGAYKMTEALDFNAGMGGVFYVDDDITLPGIGDVTYKKTIYFMAFGVQYKFM